MNDYTGIGSINTLEKASKLIEKLSNKIIDLEAELQAQRNISCKSQSKFNQIKLIVNHAQKSMSTKRLYKSIVNIVNL